MSTVSFRGGAITVKVRYVKLVPGRRSFYYVRRIPKDVLPHYRGKDTIKETLRTEDLVEASKKVVAINKDYETHWEALRTALHKHPHVTTRQTRDAAMALLKQLDLNPGDALLELSSPYEQSPLEVLSNYFEARHGMGSLDEVRFPTGDTSDESDDAALAELIGHVGREAVRLVKSDPSDSRMLLSDALDHYLRDHDKGSDDDFAHRTRYAVNLAIEAVGDKSLASLKRSDAAAVRDHMLSKGMRTTSARRRLNSIKAVVNKGRLESDQAFANPFERLGITKEGQDSEDRLPFTHEELLTVAKACLAKDDDIRWLVAMLLDTGARMAEIVGLRNEDISLDRPIPHVFIRPHEGRGVKTKASSRTVPLVGMALWGATRGAKAAEGGWLFPRYIAKGKAKATHTSNTIAGWIKGLGIDKTAHSFRHSMRDRLRDARVPQEIQDIIGGWSTRTIGQGYGQGYSLERLAEFMSKVGLPTSLKSRGDGR
jgi:integrase